MNEWERAEQQLMSQVRQREAGERRERIATAALQGLLASERENYNRFAGGDAPITLADAAVVFADALIARLGI